jgi:hypothetical protein
MQASVPQPAVRSLDTLVDILLLEIQRQCAGFPRMQVGAADRATRHLDDRIARVLDLRTPNDVAAHLAFAVP